MGMFMLSYYQVTLPVHSAEEASHRGEQPASGWRRDQFQSLGLAEGRPQDEL